MDLRESETKNSKSIQEHPKESLTDKFKRIQKKMIPKWI